MRKTIVRPPKIYYNENKEPYIIHNKKKYSLKGYTNDEILKILDKLKNKEINIQDVNKGEIIKLINDQIKQFLKNKKQPRIKSFNPSSRRIRQTSDRLNNKKSEIKELIELLKLQIIAKNDINKKKEEEEKTKKYINEKMKDINSKYKSIEDKDSIEKKQKMKEEEEYFNNFINQKNEEIKQLDNNKEDLIKTITEMNNDKKIFKNELDNYRKIKNELDNQILKSSQENKELLKENQKFKETYKNLIDSIQKLDKDNKNIKLSIQNKNEELEKLNEILLFKEKENNIIQGEKKRILDDLEQTKEINKRIIEKQKNKILKSNINQEIIKKNIDKLENVNNEIENKFKKTEIKLNNLINEYDKINFMQENVGLKTTKLEDKYIKEGYIKDGELLKRFGKAKSGKAVYNKDLDYIKKYIYDKKPIEHKIKIDDILKEEKPIIKQEIKGEIKEEIKEEEPQEGEGKGINNDGLTDEDINKIMSVYKCYIKTISHDELDDMINYITDHNILKSCFIINTLNRNQNNEIGHWCAIYICLDDPYYSIEWFDSYGNKPDSIIIGKFKKMIEKMEIPTFIKFKFNKIKQQYNDSSTCGYHCILFLLKRLYNISFKDATNYNKTIKENEDNIEKFKQFYENFKLI